MKPAPNAIELWCEEVEKLKFSVPALNKEQCSNLIGFSLSADKIDTDKDLLSLVEAKKAGLLSVFWLRVKYCHTYSITLSAALFISRVVLFNFGTSTMVANYLQWVAWKYHQPKITLDFLCITVWPMGVPTEEQWQKLWDMQKVDIEYLQPGGECYNGPDNILDYEKYAETIRRI